jgi:transcriptional regulator with XRE-family HTH domain
MFLPSNPKLLSAAIRSGRAALKWSQAELAESSGVSMPTIARIETGLISPRMDTIGLLFAAMSQAGVEFEWPAGTVGYVMRVDYDNKKMSST